MTICQDSVFYVCSFTCSISSQPRDIVVVYGRLEVKIERSQYPAKFQWFKNGHQLSGKTDKQLIIASTVDSDQGSYQCQISTSEGSVLSHSAKIKVVSVVPPQQRFEHKPANASSYREQFHNSHYNSSMYGLTGRGVDDDTESPSSQPITIRPTEPSPVPSTGMWRSLRWKSFHRVPTCTVIMCE